MKSLKEQVADLERRKVRDFDPEDDGYLRPGDDEESENEEDLHDNVSRAHYETVGKSRLRQPEQPTLDAKYGGVAVSRTVLEDEVDDEDPFAPVDEEEERDPFAARHEDSSSSEGASGAGDKESGPDTDQDEEVESDETLGEDHADRRKGLGLQGSSAKVPRSVDAKKEDSLDEMESDGSDLSEDQSSGETDVDMEDDEGEGEDEDEDASSVSSATSTSPPRDEKSSRSAEREELRKAAFDSVSTAALASALSAGANADVKKGRAVKQQRQTFDRLLDARIKLQKGITAMNELPPSFVSEQEVKSAARQAEDAALALWSTIDSIRSAILLAQGGSLSDDDDKAETKPLKRKRPLNPTGTTPLSELWDHYTSLDRHSHPLRRGVIDKWHAKTQPVLDPTPRSNLLKPSRPLATSSRLTDVIDTYLATESSKLVAQSYSQDTQAYDDGPFYQSLLRDLIASRSTGNAAIITTEAGIILTPALPTRLHVPGSKHKKVDTKASKGRKIRYTVHEKLENFMAPEDRSTWSEPARVEFFGSLLGRVGALDERERGSDDETDRVERIQPDEEDTGEVEALRLFRR